MSKRGNAFIVNLGEALQLITGNYFLATPHRVTTLTPPISIRSRGSSSHPQVFACNERYSIGFFYGPSLDFSLRPLELEPSLVSAVAAST